MIQLSAYLSEYRSMKQAHPTPTTHRERERERERERVRETHVLGFLEMLARIVRECV